MRLSWIPPIFEPGKETSSGIVPILPSSLFPALTCFTPMRRTEVRLESDIVGNGLGEPCGGGTVRDVLAVILDRMHEFVQYYTCQSVCLV